MSNLETSLLLLKIQTYVIIYNVFLYLLNSFDLTKFLSFLLSQKLNALNDIWH